MRATATPTKAAKNGSAKMRWRGERSGARPVRTRVERSGGPAKAMRPQATSSGLRRRRIAIPQAASARKTTNVQPLPPPKPRTASSSWCRASRPGREAALLLRAQLETVGQAQVGDCERDHGEDRDHGGPGGTQRPPAPEEERDRGFDGDHDSSVRVHRRQKPGRGGRGGHGARRRALDAAHEEVDGKSRREGEERVHAPEAPVDGEHPRGRGNDRRGDTGDTPVQPPAEVVAEDDRRDGEDDGDPAQGLRRGVEEEGEVDEDEVERRAAAVPHRRGDHLPERPRGDEPGNGLVLEERLRADVGDELDEEVGARAHHRPPRREAREARRADAPAR